MSTLGTIRGNVRRNLGETTAHFWSDAELNQGIAEAYKKYVNFLIKEGDGYFVTSINVGFTANVETVSISNLALPFKKEVRLQKNLSSGGSTPLEFNEQRFVTNNTLVGGIGDGYSPKWYIRGMNLVLWPRPQASEAASDTTGLKFDYTYIPTYPNASSVDGFTFSEDFPVDYEPAIELYATIAALENKDGMGGVADIQSFRGRLQEWEALIIETMTREETPDRVQYVGINYTNPFWGY